jgi:hypothetical protein
VVRVPIRRQPSRRLVANPSKLDTARTSPRVRCLLRTGPTRVSGKNMPGMKQGMTRPDGSKKSNRGYLGQIKRDDGGVMTEFSIGVEIGGQEVLIPSLVPTLSKEQIETLRTLPEGQPIPREIIVKAVDHARPLLQQGKSPFYQDKKKNKPLIKAAPESAKKKPKSLLK